MPDNTLSDRVRAVSCDRNVATDKHGGSKEKSGANVKWMKPSHKRVLTGNGSKRLWKDKVMMK
jgi:hypothetical protein